MNEDLVTQNSIVSAVQVITRLVDNIKNQYSSSDNGDGKNSSGNQDVQLLKTKCGDENPIISITASQGILLLVEDGTLSIGSTLSDLIVCLSTAKSCTGITMAIGNLLLLDMRRCLDSKKSYKCPFSIQKNQHPFVKILTQDKDLSIEVFKQIEVFVRHFDEKISSNSLELLRPVLFFMLSKPVNKLSETCRKKLWNLLISINKPESYQLIFELLSWIKINDKQNCMEMCDYLTSLSQVVIKNNDLKLCLVIVLYLCSLLIDIIKEGCDPTSYVRTILDILKTPGTETSHSVILMLLSQTITICPPIYLREILHLCNSIVIKRCSNILSVNLIVTTLIQWFLYPSCLLNESMKIAKDIVTFVENNDEYGSFTSYLCCNPYIKYISTSHPQIDYTLRLCLLSEKWQDKPKYLEKWLDSLSDNNGLLPYLFSFLSSIFVCYDRTIRQKSLKILTDIVKTRKEFASKLLILILYKLHNERDPETQVFLLKAIPETAVLKDNMPLILTTLNTISNENNSLKSLALTLYLKLFHIEVRTFPYLQKLLMEPGKDYEFNVVKVQTLKEICLKKPELHGKEMVGLLAEVLNKNSGPKGALPSSLAIDGLTGLCEANIIDIASTWTSLSPKFSKDKRLLVLKSLCEFFGGFSEVRANSKENEMIINEVVNKLWESVSYCSEKEVVLAALKSLGNFDVNEIGLKQLPDLYRQNLVLPSAYAKTPEEAARKPEDCLPYIPGECWIQMLQNTNHHVLDDVGNLLIDWVHAEISDYSKSVYYVPEGKTEPVDYNYLPAKSIVRAIGNSVMLTANGSMKIPLTNPILLQCLRILSQSYPKPLPPLNWCFLHELFHKDDEIRLLCISLACKQILISGSALRFVENYINSFEPSIDKCKEILVVFTNLNMLCKGIAPNMLRPMLTKSLQFAYNTAVDVNDDSSLYKQITINIKQALVADDIHDANRILIGQILEEFVEQISGTSQLFDQLLDCIVESPTKYMERISSPSLWWETTQEKFQRAVKVRCLMAKRAGKTPFVWLNECINTATTLQSLQSYLLENIVGVFEERRGHIDSGSWILELLGQIQDGVADKADLENNTYLCDVFLMAIIVLTGHDCLVSPNNLCLMSKETRLSLFPNAIRDFVRNRPNISVQVMEWLYHMATCPSVPDEYQKVFFQSLITLRHEKAFIESARWMKYMSLKYPN